MNILITINSILERHSTPLSRKRINGLLNKTDNKLGKFYLYLDSGISEREVARLLGYSHEKEKNYLMLKKRLRSFLEDTMKLCDLGKNNAPEPSYFERLNNIVQLVRVMRKEQNHVLTHYYSLKGIKMAEESGHMEIWLECLKTELLYYHDMGNLPLLNETDLKIKKLTSEINLMNEMLSFILREEIELRKPLPYDTKAWDEKTLYLEKEIARFKAETKATNSKHVQLAALTAELLVAVRNDDGPAWRRLVEEGFQLVDGNMNMNPTYISFIYLFRGVALVLSENYQALDDFIKYLNPLCERYAIFHFNITTLRVSALLQQQQYDEAYLLFMDSLKIKIPLKMQNQELETRHDFIILVFHFLYHCQKLNPKIVDARELTQVAKKDLLPWQQDLRVYRVILLDLCICDIAAARITSAKRTFKKLQTHLEAYPYGAQTRRLQYLVSAIEQYLVFYPDRARIQAHSGEYILALQNSSDNKNGDEFFPYLSVWALLMERLGTDHLSAGT